MVKKMKIVSDEARSVDYRSRCPKLTYRCFSVYDFQAVRVFAGARQNRRGDVYPTGTGRLCNWKPDPNQPPADEFASFGAYQRTLTLECDQGEPGIVQWTPDRNTPDTVYYQVQ